MTTALVSRAEMKAALRIDGTDLDTTLDIYIAAASSAVAKHVAASLTPYLDEDDEIDDVTLIPAEWKQATMLLVGYFVRNPDADPDRDFAEGLPSPVVSLLRPYRDPALA